jgi:hypothetical protein
MIMGMKSANWKVRLTRKHSRCYIYLILWLCCLTESEHETVITVVVKKGIHCEVSMARLREIGIGATVLNKAAYRSV